MSKTNLKDLPVVEDLSVAEAAKVKGGTDSEWKYVPVRRFASSTEESDSSGEEFQIDYQEIKWD